MEAWNLPIRRLWSVTRSMYSWIWRLIRPTLIPAMLANQRVRQDTPEELDACERQWYERLASQPAEARSSLTHLLYALFESDQDRIRGLESKARGVPQTAALVLAGNPVTLILAPSSGIWPLLVIVLVIVSLVYGAAAVGAALYADKPRRRHLIRPEDVLPLEQAGAALVRATRANRAGSIRQSNLAESAIHDVARALVTTGVALLTAVLIN